MHKGSLFGRVAAIAVAITIGAADAAVAQPSGSGPGWMGPGMMYGGPGGGYGPGWMGPGMMYGHGYGRGGWRPQQENLNLTVDQVKSNMQRWLAAEGNPHLKLGNVAAKDANTITADVITTDKDALVERFDINRQTGFVQPVD